MCNSIVFQISQLNYSLTSNFTYSTFSNELELQ